MEKSGENKTKSAKTCRITKEIIKQREELQNSVLTHSHQLIDQLMKNLDELEKAINRKLSSSHLIRLINYIKDDLEPLKDFVTKISSHAEKLGSLKKEYENQGALSEGLQELYTTLSSSEVIDASNSCYTHYMIGKDARKDTAKLKYRSRSPSPPYYTPKSTISPKKQTKVNENMELNTRNNDNGDFPPQKEHFNFDVMHFSQFLKVIVKACEELVKQNLGGAAAWLRLMKEKLTGRKGFGISDVFIAITLLLIINYLATDLWPYSHKVWSGKKRRVPM